MWYPQRTICYAEMESQAANRKYDELHEAAPFHDGTFTEWAEKPSAATPYHFRDGVSVWVAPVDLSPGDKFLSDPRAPGKPRGGESNRDQA